MNLRCLQSFLLRCSYRDCSLFRVWYGDDKVSTLNVPDYNRKYWLIYMLINSPCSSLVALHANSCLSCQYYCGNIRRIQYHGMANFLRGTSASVSFSNSLKQAISILGYDNNYVLASCSTCITICLWWVAKRCMRDIRIHWQTHISQIVKPHIRCTSRRAPNGCIMPSPCGHQRARISTYILTQFYQYNTEVA